MIFTDESKFQFYRVESNNETLGKIWQIRKKWYQSSPSLVTVRGGIRKLGLTPLIFISGTIDLVKYCEILQEGLLDSVIGSSSIPCRLEQDNAMPRDTTYTRKWLDQSHVTLLPWPAASPDLSPIENVWQVMKDNLEKLQPDTIAEWKSVIQETWKGSSQNYIDNLIDSVPRRMKQSVARNGDLTDY